MKWLHVATAIAASSWLLAQTPTAQKVTPASTSVDERAQTMREHMESGMPLKSHVKVAVRLKNGNRLRGVVKDGKLVERIDGLRFVDAQAREPGAGIRLWYSSGVRNYVFVPFSQFAEYEVLQRLSQKDLEEMERELQREEVRRAEREAAQAPAAGAEGAPPGAADEQGKPPAPTEKAAKDPAAKKGAVPAGEAKLETEQSRAWFALAQEYPPSAGWSAAKRDEISRRLAVIGAKPSESELRFVEKFAEWQKACAHFGLETTAKPAAEKAGTEPEPSSRRRKRA